MDEQYGQLIEPTSVKFSFGAPGWYVLGVLFLLVLVCAAWLLYRYYKRNKYRAEAVKQLQVLQSQFAASGAQAQLVYEVNMLLKRVAMARYHRHATAGVRGNVWIAYLNQTANEQLFDEADAKLLTDHIYATHAVIPAEKADDFAEKAKRWMKTHRRKIAELS